MEWYLARSEVSREFADTVQAAARRIQRAPGAYARWPGIDGEEIRRCVLKRFPFVVIYAVEHGGILVLAVAHTSQRPGYWIRRLGG